MLKKNTQNIISQNKHLVFPLLSGLLMIAAFPPFEQGYVTWFALMPLIATCLQTTPLRAFWAGFIFGLPLHFYVNIYLSHVLFPYLPAYLAVIAMISLVAYISLFSAVFGLFTSLLNRVGKAWFTALAVPSLWLLTEYLRSLSFLAYNVGYLGYTQWNYPLFLNITSIYGYWGLSFLIVFFQVLFLLILMNRLQGTGRYALTTVFLIMLLAGLTVPELLPVHKDKNKLTVSLIQGNSHPEQVADSRQEDVVQLYSNLTEQALAGDAEIDLVVWPETVARLDFSEKREHHPSIIKLAEKYEVSVLYGARVRKQDLLYNSITLYYEGQEEIPVYHKHRLVPFVEYFPMEQLLNRVLELDLLLGSYSAGEEITVFDLRGVPVGGSICFESYFGDHTRLFAKKESRHLFILTNDAWFDESIGLEQHAQAAAIRAAEMGVGVTQVANSGLTISFNHRGEELFRSGKNEAAVFTMPLDLTTRDTLYVLYGDYFPAVWALFLIIVTPVVILRKSVN